MNGYFVTGTDTDAGKTYVACALARRAVARGHNVLAFKPIETGCAVGPAGRLVGADQERLAEAAGNWQIGPLRGLYRFPLPAAPSVAASAGAASIDLERIVRTLRDGVSEHAVSFSVVEGAGGWRVPITHTADMSTLSRELGLPVIIVARAGLGTINHSLLTIEAVERDGQTVAAVVLSRRSADDPIASLSNRTEIERRWAGKVWIFDEDPGVLDDLIPVL